MVEMKEYTFRQKIRPFMRGFLVGGPLVEVALEGLRRGVGEPLASEYESKVAQKGNTRQICAALRLGLGAEAEDRLAAAYAKRYALEKDREATHIVPAASIHVPVYIDMRPRFAAISMWEVADLLSEGKVASHKAQDGFAAMVIAEGNRNHAEKILASGKVGSGKAIALLQAKLG
ncbi:MAG TPA: hypothetical protein VLD37_02810 [Candidatus Bilamarchaeum sp.]|nr:hypothetical protein [Candidatus Bilamarchaeum sp.]